MARAWTGVPGRLRQLPPADINTGTWRTAGPEAANRGVGSTDCQSHPRTFNRPLLQPISSGSDNECYVNQRVRKGRVSGFKGASRVTNSQRWCVAARGCEPPESIRLPASRAGRGCLPLGSGRSDRVWMWRRVRRCVGLDPWRASAVAQEVSTRELASLARGRCAGQQARAPEPGGCRARAEPWARTRAGPSAANLEPSSTSSP